MAEAVLENSIYTVQKMQKCKDAGYACEGCESYPGCKLSKWVCTCCGKHTNYLSAVKRVFRK